MEKKTQVEEKEEIKEEATKEEKKIGEKIKEEDGAWTPKTELGTLVKSGKITSLEEIWEAGRIIKEPEIVNFIMADLEERVLKLGKGKRPFKWVQRMTDSGRRNKYFVMVAVGNKNGVVGVGRGKAKEYRDAIASAIRNSKLNVMKIKRGCGSWDCHCTDTHSIPFEITGKNGSVKVTLKPAPKGTGLALNDTSKDILELAGVKDAWSYVSGHTKTRLNLVMATYNALANLARIKQ